MLAFSLMAIFKQRKFNEMKAFLLSLFFFVIYSAISAQVGFYNGTSKVLGEEELHSTICVGFEDLNGDLRDDLFLLDEGKLLKTFVQGSPAQSFSFKEHFHVSAFGDWAVISGDLDNDGIPEIICSGAENGSQFLKSNGDSYTTMFNTADVYSQNTNLVDLNNDGFLDFFVCNDDGESLTYINNGSGGMTQTQLIDFQTTPEDDMSGNYTSIFTDIDGDDDLDLYIGKCKAGVTDPTDPRRINTLYLNNGDDTYTESGVEAGLANGSQTWSVDAGDVDNDGDVDMIIANHDREHDLMLNDGTGKFERHTMVPGGYTSFAFQSFFCDFDNNGWLDIFITDPEATFILFNDEMSFTRRDIVTEGKKAFSGASGDLNFDGFPDLYLTFANSFQQASTTADRVMLNESNTNNFIDINLIGSQSNRDGVGSKVYVYHDGQRQFRELIVGKSYGIMNTNVLHFGLGHSSQIDSILVKWPSGQATILNDVEVVNTQITIEESGCVSMTYPLPQLQLCDGDSILVALSEEFENVNWSNGDSGVSTWIKEEGWYEVTFEDSGCLTRSSYFEVTEENVLEPSDVLAAANIAACEGDIVELEAHPGTGYFWSNEATSQTIDVVESGVYNVILSTNCDNYTSEDVNVYFAEVVPPIVENDSVMLGENALFIGDNENLNWYQDKNDLEPIATGSTFESPEIFEDQTYYVGEVTEGYGFNGALMGTVPLNSVGDTIYKANEFIEFEVSTPMILYSIKVRTQHAGVRKVLILKGQDELAAFDFNLTEGVNTLTLDIPLDEGVYRLGTDISVNQELLGTDHPGLSYSQFYVEKDKEIEGCLKVADSEMYPGVSPYFFDWQVYYGYYFCESRIPVYAVIKDPVSTDEISLLSRVFPNPTAGRITIQTDEIELNEIEVYDFTGARVLKKSTVGQTSIDVEMPTQAGFYFLKLKGESANSVHKIYVY